MIFVSICLKTQQPIWCQEEAESEENSVGNLKLHASRQETASDGPLPAMRRCEVQKNRKRRVRTGAVICWLFLCSIKLPRKTNPMLLAAMDPSFLTLSS